MLLDFNLDLDSSCAITIEIENLIVRKTIFASVYFVVTTCNSCTTKSCEFNIKLLNMVKNIYLLLSGVDSNTSNKYT